MTTFVFPLKNDKSITVYPLKNDKSNLIYPLKNDKDSVYHPVYKISQKSPKKIPE